MRKHLKIFACYFRLNLASALEYRASFFAQAFGMALSNSSFLFFWWIAFQQIGGAIAGYTFQDVLFIWAVTSSGYGLSHILFANVSSLSKLIVTGELDTYLLQPCSVLLNVLCAKTTLSAYGDLFYGLILMILVYAGNPAAWLWFFCGTLLCGVLVTAINLSAHTLSFYWGHVPLLGQLAEEFTINFSIYPDKIYAPAVRALMYSLIPAGIAVHLPLRLFQQFSPGLALAAGGGAIAYCVLSGFFFYRGLRRYESGNMIVTKL
jgi:ABC-2 type transport system permease protein